MNPRSFSALLLLVLLVVRPSVGGAQTSGKASADLVSRAAAQPVRVIVQLDVEARPASIAGDDRASSAHRMSIALAQAAALDALRADEGSVRRFETIPAFSATVDADSLQRLLAMPSVVAVHEDRRMSRALFSSNEKIGSADLWPLGIEGAGWSVAVLDDGVDRNHQFLAGKVTHEACFSTTSTDLGATSLCPGGVSRSNNPGSARPCPGCDHGTHVAGIAAGRSISGTLTLSGVAREAKIVAVQVFSAFGGSQEAYVSDIILGLEYVLSLAGSNNSGRIAAVNLSVQEGEYAAACDADFGPLKQAIDNLRAVGIATVVASGNAGFSNALAAPACISSTISVGATNRDDTISPFSNFGSNLDLLAPGENILSSSLLNGFAPKSGSSAAAPHVAGAWALLKSLEPQASVDHVLRSLRETGVPLFEYGSGLTIPRIAVNRAAGSLGADGSPASVVLNVSGANITATWDPPFNGVSPVGYRVELVGDSNGYTGITDVGNTRVFATTLPAGRYRLRVRTIEASGVGNASNYLPFTIAPLQNVNAPFAPQDLRVEFFNNIVTLSWNLGTGSPAALGYFIDVGTAPGLSNYGAFNTGSPATRLTATPPTAAGSFYIRVRAYNQFGVSGPSNEVRLDITAGGGGPCGAVPGTPTGLFATVVESLVTLTWNQPVTSGAITGYVLEAGSGPGITDILRAPLGVTTAFSGVAAPGLYFVRVRAVNACGQSAPSNEILVVVR
jgi:subtilisin family serine protease